MWRSVGSWICPIYHYLSSCWSCFGWWLAKKHQEFSHHMLMQQTTISYVVQLAFQVDKERSMYRRFRQCNLPSKSSHQPIWCHESEFIINFQISLKNIEKSMSLPTTVSLKDPYVLLIILIYIYILYHLRTSNFPKVALKSHDLTIRSFRSVAHRHSPTRSPVWVSARSQVATNPGPTKPSSLYPGMGVVINGWFDDGV